MLTEPTPSPMDLRWRMFGIPVRVHPTFWLFSALFGWGVTQSYGFAYLAMWIACMFLSILVHELGHALTARAFGEPSSIVLYSFGGLATGQFHRLGVWQRIAVILAGPGAGFALFGLVSLFFHYVMPRIDPTRGTFIVSRSIGFLLFMNLFWNVMNLVPVYPLDGGQVLREVCYLVHRRNATIVSLGISMVIAGLIAIYAIMAHNNSDLWFPEFSGLRMDKMFLAIIFGLMAIQNFILLQQADRERRRWENDENPW